MSGPTPKDRHRLFDLIRSNGLFCRMAARQGVDLSGTWWRGLEHMIGRALARCAKCSGARECGEWLDQDHAERYPGYCPNKTLIEACRIMDPHASPPADSVGATRLESDLDELLDDPLIKQVMDADGVDRARLHAALLSELRAAVVTALPASR